MATYLSRSNEQIGPFEDEQILARLAARECSPTDLAWREGMAAWAPLSTLFPTSATELLPPLPVKPTAGDDFGTRLLLPVGRSGWAIAAGYFGLFSLIILPAPIALILSIVAIWDIRKHRNAPHPKHGMGRAIFGLVMGLLGTGLIVFFLITAVLSSSR